MAVVGTMPPAHMAMVDSPSFSSSAFRFTDLPGELRQDVYRQYFGSWDAVIEYDRRSAYFKISGLPLYGMLLANRASHLECCDFITKAYSGRLILRDIKVPRERGFGFVSSLDVMASLCPNWLLDLTKSLTIEQGTTRMLTTLPWYNLNALEEVCLEGNSWPVAHQYPCGLSARAKEAQAESIIQGQYDTWCVHGYGKWSQVPEPIAEGRVRVVTIRQGWVKGAFLKVRVQHNVNEVEVLDRSINSVIQPKTSDDQPKPVQPIVFCRPM